jgi:hypothetical protein
VPMLLQPLLASLALVFGVTFRAQGARGVTFRGVFVVETNPIPLRSEF